MRWKAWLGVLCAMVVWGCQRGEEARVEEGAGDAAAGVEANMRAQLSGASVAFSSVDGGCVLGLLEGRWWVTPMVWGEPVEVALVVDEVVGGAMVGVEGRCLGVVVGAERGVRVEAGEVGEAWEVRERAAWVKEVVSERGEVAAYGVLVEGLKAVVWRGEVELGGAGVWALGSALERAEAGRVVKGWPRVPSPARAPLWVVERPREGVVLGWAVFTH